LPAPDGRRLAVITNADGKSGNPVGGVLCLPITENHGDGIPVSDDRRAAARLGGDGGDAGTEENLVAAAAPGPGLGSLGLTVAALAPLFAFALASALTRREIGSYGTKRGPFRSSFTLNLAATPICAVRPPVLSTLAGS